MRVQKIEISRGVVRIRYSGDIHVPITEAKGLMIWKRKMNDALGVVEMLTDGITQRVTVLRVKKRSNMKRWGNELEYEEAMER